MGVHYLRDDREQLRDSIAKDCQLIMEAIRRLIEGTCCLEGDEKVCTWDLFHKTREAVLEHIQFEERWIFPKLAAHERDFHREEHHRLLTALEKARWDFEVSDGEMFRDRLVEFKDLLEQHHALGLFCECVGTDDLDPSRDVNVAHILERTRRALLA